MELIRKFDFRVFIVLAVLAIGVDFFKDENFNNMDIVYGVISAFIGTVLWAVLKNKLV